MTFLIKTLKQPDNEVRRRVRPQRPRGIGVSNQHKSVPDNFAGQVEWLAVDIDGHPACSLEFYSRGGHSDISSNEIA
ncbi:hypothetical protein GB937_005390 [Aspergillus fischeri]|nr:hypothetical protein GB937_005390 [Aspergillus fischeri]